MHKQLIQISILSLAAIALWLIFYPGLLSYDSLQQYAQARNWDFNDWHPPLMAFVLGIVLQLGGDVGFLTLATCLLGTLGIRALLIELNCQPWLATVAALCFLLPINPLPFYLVTFWKDAWVAVVLPWLFVGLLRLRHASAPLRAAVSPVVLAGLLPSIRHNAALTLPFIGLSLWLVCKSLPKMQKVVVAVSPIIFALLAHYFWYSVLGVKRTYVGNAVKQVELQALCERWPSRCNYPYTQKHLNEESWNAYRDDHARTSLLWGHSAFEPNHELNSEYQRAIREGPLRLTMIKLRNFYWMLLPQENYPFQSSIDDNEFGLHGNTRFTGARAPLVQAGKAAAASPLGLALIYHHTPWFILAHLLFLASLYFRHWFYTAQLLIPLSYFYSYLLASTVMDFRLMFPASLLVMVGLSALLLRATYAGVTVARALPIRSR